MNSNDKLIALVDMDYFFAQCEELRNAALKAKPLAVCMLTAPDRGAVSSANYVARKQGVKVGMPVSTAKRQASDIAILRVDMPYYASISSKIMIALRSKFKKVEVASIDEAYIEIETSEYKEAVNIGKEIKYIVLDETRIRCTVGIGPNKLIAKMACDSSKPNGLKVITKERSTDFIKKFKLNEIPYIGNKTAERLSTMGCNSVNEAKGLPLERLVHEFGQKKGVFIYNALRGIDERPLQTNKVRKEYEKFATLGQKDKFELIDELSASLYLRLGGTMFQEIGVIIIYDDMDVRTMARTLKFFANSVETIKNESKKLLLETLAMDNRKIRRIGLKVSKLKQVNYQTLSDFMN